MLSSERLATLAGQAPRSRANVRTLAKFAANSGCKLATLGFATRVDLDRVLVGTRFEVPFGQSPFAFRRGNTFEERLRRDGHRPLLEQFGSTLGYDIATAKVVNLRNGGRADDGGMPARASTTTDLVRAIVRGDAGAPNLLDGAVLTRVVGGVPAFFEADAVAARFAAPLHVGEIKSFPTVDGQADPDKVGAAIAQVAIYVVLLRELVVRVGGDPNLVSSDALLITPKNTGLQPTMVVKPVGREVDRAARILDQVPSATALVDALPQNVPSFGVVADRRAPEAARIDSAVEMAEKVGTAYQPSCLSSCGMSRLCRERAYQRGSPERFGGKLVRLLPNIKSLDRVVGLAKGDPARADEAPVAEQLVRAERLRRRAGAA